MKIAFYMLAAKTFKTNSSLLVSKLEIMTKAYSSEKYLAVSPVSTIVF